MKSTKLLAVLFLLFISTTIFAQKVHYKDSYYTIVKSKIFHRGHDVYGQLTPGKIDTIHTIAKELYTEKGKLKDKYKKRKKRDRYKLPENFWKQKSGAITRTVNTNENKATETVAVLSEAENQKVKTVVIETSTTATITAPIIKEEKILEKVQNEEATEPKKTAIVIENKKSEKEEMSVREKEKKTVMKEKTEQQKEEKKEKINKREKEQEKRVQEIVAKKAKNSDSKQLKEKENKTEKSLAKEKLAYKNSSEKNDKKQSQEAKKLENKKKDLDKEKDTQLKKQKLLEAKEAALVSARVVSTSVSNNDTFGTIYIKVNKEKTNAIKDGAILLFFDVINNSNKDLVILKPNNTRDSRLDFFSNTMECEDIPIKATTYIAKDLKIKDEDYLTIPANTKIELFVNGTYRNWLACNSEDIILQIQYNPFKSTEEETALQPAYKKELSKSLKRVTSLKIESENIKFKLNREE